MRHPIIPAALGIFPPFALVIWLGLRLSQGQLSLLGAVALFLATLWFGIQLVHWLSQLREHRKSPQPVSKVAPEHSPPPRALVYFLSDPRQPTVETIRSCLTHALGLPSEFASLPTKKIRITAGRAPAPSSEGHTVQHFVIELPQGRFGIFYSDTPYMENPVEFAAESIRDKRLRQAVEQHRAWISVDFLESRRTPLSSPDIYALLGKILASIAGPDCLAIYSPELQRCNEFDLTLLDDLKRGKPLSVFSEPTFEPIYEIAADDERMAAAVREARQRWPEFVHEFTHNVPAQGSDRFLVKAEFSEGNKSEFMWVLVMALDDDQIHGELLNDPHELVDIHRGARLSLPRSQIADWLYRDAGGRIVGGFTLPILADEDDS
jgi:uncharacterized protein YegJ (DUF2314 family)